MAIPTKVQSVVEKVDRVIQRLFDDRLGYYEIVSKKYHDIKAGYYLAEGKKAEDVPPLGFEAFISADMRRELEKEFDPSAVFMEFPGIGKDKIDIFVESGDVNAYIENKMYATPGKDSPKNDYRHDFNKVRALIDLESSMSCVVGFLVNFQLYNKTQAAHDLYKQFASELAPEEWWVDMKCIGPKNKKHFVRLLFGRHE